MIFDLSLKSNNHWFKQFDFSRDEIKKLIKKSADLMKKSNLNQTEHPHLGMLCMIISNFILRSRNNYKFNNIYKCINRDVVEKSFENCGKVANFGRIPGRWGGNIAAPEYSEDAYKRLAYIKANDTVHTRFICDISEDTTNICLDI